MNYNYINRVVVENYRCHKKTETHFLPLTILTGSNAAGKSGFLQALLLGLTHFTKLSKSLAWEKEKTNIKRKLANLREKENFNPMGNNEILTIMENIPSIRTDDIFGMSLGLPANIIAENSDESNVRISINFGENKSEVVFALPDDEDEYLFKVSSSRAPLGVWEDKPIFFLSAERIGPRLVSEFHTLKPNSVGIFGEDTAYVIKNLDKRRQKNLLPKALGIMGQERFEANCEAWLNEIIPGTELKCTIETEKRQAVLEFRNNTGERFRLPTETGFGITYVLPVIVQALAASVLPNSVLIVENPEVHLHPYSQSQIGKFLALVAENGVQVIIETHSDHVIDGCRIQSLKSQNCDQMKVLFFDKYNEENICQEINLTNMGELESWPKGFFDQLQLDLRELLRMRGI